MKIKIPKKESNIYAEELFAKRNSPIFALPEKKRVQKFAENLLSLLFPHFSKKIYFSSDEIAAEITLLKNELANLLHPLNGKLKTDSKKAAKMFFDNLREIHFSLLDDAKAISEGDPASNGTDEVILTYPGFFAIAVYRIAHELYELKVPFYPRLLTEYAHQLTGIDINPGAKIGKSFFIDHGTGIVIGETSVIGNNVKIYQGVTLGALSVKKELSSVKRHPTIEDDVVIYSGATILGGDTIIGKGSVIGGNVWLTESVPPNSIVYHKSQIRVRNFKESAEDAFDFVI